MKVGDEVWVKPPHARCTMQWKKGYVTRINTKNNVSVDGMPRHILDVRRVVRPVGEGAQAEIVESEGQDDLPLGISEVKCSSDEHRSHSGEVEAEQRYPRRVRRPPVWLDEYETGEFEW